MKNYLSILSCVALCSLLVVANNTSAASEGHHGDSENDVYCGTIAYSPHYCNANDSDATDVLMPGDDDNRRDQMERYKLIMKLRAEKQHSMYGGMFNWASLQSPAEILAEELAIIDANYTLDKKTVDFLETLHTLIDGKTHKEQLTDILSIVKGLYGKTVSIDKAGMAEVLYYVILKYIVSGISV